MFKTNNKRIISGIIFGLGILAVLAFAPIKVDAQYYYNDGYAHLDQLANPTPFISSATQTSSNNGTVIIKGYGFIPSSRAKLNGVDSPTTFIDSSHLLVRLNTGNLSGNDPMYISVMNGEPGGGYSNAILLNNPTMVTNTNTYNSNSTSTTNNSANNSYSGNTNNTTGSVSALASNAIFGGNSLVPSGLIEWVLFGIVILLIIIIVRKFTGASDRYHNSPLKHS
ncbi:MAG: hypothetical protein KGL67_02800 [Patescibacteria group bacterium]|nr:hypothetical protein [Patescibacteria group bacterium]